MDSLPQLSLGTAAVLIFGCCVIFILVRGITRMLINTGVLAISTLFAFLTWQKAPGFSHDWFGKSVGVITTGLPVLVFIATFVVIRLALKWIRTPFGETKETQAPTSQGIPMVKMSILLGIALIPTLLVMLIAIGIIHHTASVNELRDYAGSSKSTETTYLQKLKTSIEAIVPQSVLETIDPYADRSRLALAKWVTRQSRPEPEPVIDPATGKPIPRAIIVEDPELDELAREQKFGTLLRHPIITKALDDPRVQNLLKDLKL